MLARLRRSAIAIAVCILASPLPSCHGESYVPELGEIMLLTQMRHIGPLAGPLMVSVAVTKPASKPALARLELWATRDVLIPLLPPSKTLQLTRRRRSPCEALQPAGGRAGGRSAGRPPEYHGGTRAARS